MRILLSAFAGLFLSGAASAQPPVEVLPESTLYLSIGQIKVFRFDEKVGAVNVMSKGAVEAMPQTDHQISITGIAAGDTRMMVFSPDGRPLFSSLVTVTPEPGRVIKIYGTGKNDDVNAGFVQVYCNEFGCGRPDKDLPPAQLSVERVSRGSRYER